MIVRVGLARSYALNKLEGAPVPIVGMLFTSKGIINKKFLKGGYQ